MWSVIMLTQSDSVLIEAIRFLAQHNYYFTCRFHNNNNIFAKGSLYSVFTERLFIRSESLIRFFRGLM